MKRRACILVVSASLSPFIRQAVAQGVKRAVKVGILRPGAHPMSSTDPQAAGIPDAFRELGYVEGRNLIVERRYSGGDNARMPALALELVRARVDLIVAVAAPAVRAAKDATSTIPIVMFGNFDPVALGLVASLAEPGGNVTGILIAPDGTLAGKRLELLKAIVPSAKRIGLLVPPDEPSIRLQVQETRKAAATLGVELIVHEVRGWDYASAFDAIAAQRPGALVVAANSSFLRDRGQIIELAARHRLPAMYEWREQVVDGGLMAYGANLKALYHRVARTADRIFSGTAPGNIPVEQPTRLELAINLKTAKALGLAIPQSLRLRTDEVIE